MAKTEGSPYKANPFVTAGDGGSYCLARHEDTKSQVKAYAHAHAHAHAYGNGERTWTWKW